MNDVHYLEFSDRVLSITIDLADPPGRLHACAVRVESGRLMTRSEAAAAARVAGAVLRDLGYHVYGMEIFGKGDE